MPGRTDSGAPERRVDAELLNRILEVFLASPDDVMYGEVLELVLEALHSKHGLFGYLDEEGALVCPSMTRSVWSECEVEGKSLVFPRAAWAGLWGRALTEGRSLYANGALHTPAGHIGIANALDVPIRYRGATIGNLLVGNSPVDYTDTDQEVLEGIAASVAPVLAARVERDRSRTELERRTWELGERVKELACLYGITRLSARGLPWQAVARGAVDLIPGGFQFPTTARVRVVMGELEWQSDGYAPTPWAIASEVRCGGEPIGAIEVCYPGWQPAAAEETPFIAEERALLDAIAEHLGRVMERQRAAADRDAQRSRISLMEALRSTLAIILAGGRGHRLHPITSHLAKPAVPFGGKFRLIDFPLSNCVNSGIRRVAVVTQYRAHELIQHVRAGWGFLRAERNEFVELWPAQQQTDAGTWYQGTADAVFQNLEILEGHAPCHVLILAGDHIYKQDYSVMLAEHLERGADVSVSCTEVPLDEARAFGVVRTRADQAIVAFDEKPDAPTPLDDRPTHALVSTGIYIIRTDFLIAELHRDAADPNSAHDFGHDILPALIGRGAIYAHRFARSCVTRTDRAYWRDVGTIDAYWEANIDLTRLVPELDVYDERWPIWTYQEQEPPAKFVYDGEARRGLAVDSVVSSGCIVSGATVRRSLLFRHVRVHSWAVVEDTVVLSHADIGRGARLRRAIVDWGCHVPAGLVVGEDPVEDARRFHHTERGVTLITQAMIDQLQTADAPG